MALITARNNASGLAFIYIMLLSVPCVLSSPLGAKDSCAPSDLVWLYDSPLTVHEEIDDLGDGLYRYSYSFENIDSKHIWHFLVYTVFPIGDSGTTWAERSNFWPIEIQNDLSFLDPWLFDARNLMPDLSAFCSTWDFQYEFAAEPICPGETVHGFSFVANTLDSSPKLYAYETVEDGYSSLTGYVAAIGFTGPVIVSTETKGWGGVKALYR